ncbi:probable cytochrome P450 6a14 [Linepithema humile]|uniref:probable cytochrome P450 6a14 n=1 Tax=Linepithema humile TaxID=83485 RepID=UPI000623074E|nr:PREDICTED: probable cytochrome P450 6a14 [Linepithema humile]
MYFEILCGIVTVIVLLYYYFTSNYNFWKLHGVRGPQPIPIFGTFKDVMLAKKFLGDYLKEVYNDYKEEAMIGIYHKKTPILILKDPDLIKDVLIKDFSAFSDRGAKNISEKTDPLSQHIFNLDTKRWRIIRTRLSPVFTTSKIREMFFLISKCANQLDKYVEKLTSKDKLIECRELATMYTTDVIGTCAFGIEMDALSDEGNEFRRIGKQVFNHTWNVIIRNEIRQSIPWLYDILGNFLPHLEHHTFYTRLTVENMNYREANNIVKHDFIDTLRELRNHPDKVRDIDLTDSFLASQAYSFFIAGFETSASTISYALYELALNQQIQNKLHEEINQAYLKHGDITYENIKELIYLDKVVKETLRKHTPSPLLMRQSTTNYNFNGTKVSIPKGQKVWIPIYAIQRDPSIYPEPDVFDPERFSEEAVQTRHAMYYLPFGDGPRNCIGLRFANYQTKLGLIKILQKYKFETCEKTDIPYTNKPNTNLLTPINGITLKISKIDCV